MKLLEADPIIGRPLPAQAPQGRTQSEHEELPAIGQNARSSKVDDGTAGLAEPATFQVRWTVEAAAERFGRAIQALNRIVAKQISGSFHGFVRDRSSAAGRAKGSPPCPTTTQPPLAALRSAALNRLPLPPGRDSTMAALMRQFGLRFTPAANRA